MRKNDLLIAYLYNKSEHEDDSLRMLKRNLVHRDIDQEDALELIISQTRAQLLNEILLDVLRIMGY